MKMLIKEFALGMQSGTKPWDAEAQALVNKLQDYITMHYYTCTNEILTGLGEMYVADERFKTNIDKHADGTAEYISKAIFHKSMSDAGDI